MTDKNGTEFVLNRITLAMATTFLDDLGDPGRYDGEVGILRQLLEAAKDQHAVETAEEAVKPGLYAIRHIDNWCGDRDVRTSLATYDKDGKWRYDENGAPVLEYAGDRLLQAWPLDHVGGQALTYEAGVTAAVKAIRTIMDQFRVDHSDPEPAPGTSGMSENDLATWHVMYRLEQAVRELQDGNLVPLPARETMKYETVLLVGGPRHAQQATVIAGAPEMVTYDPVPAPACDYLPGNQDLTDPGGVKRIVYRRTAINVGTWFKGAVYVFEGVDIERDVPELLDRIKYLQAQELLNREDGNG